MPLVKATLARHERRSRRLRGHDGVVSSGPAWHSSSWTECINAFSMQRSRVTTAPWKPELIVEDAMRSAHDLGLVHAPRR
jgi:hypothetical protein